MLTFFVLSMFYLIFDSTSQIVLLPNNDTTPHSPYATSLLWPQTITSSDACVLMQLDDRRPIYLLLYPLTIQRYALSSLHSPGCIRLMNYVLESGKCKVYWQMHYTWFLSRRNLFSGVTRTLYPFYVSIILLRIIDSIAANFMYFLPV